jgi:ketosteroid isomerase-like protein
MDTKYLVQSYYKSLDEKDDKWKDLYLKDAVFSDASQTLLAEGKEAVIQSFVPFLKGVAGVKLKQLIIEGESACAIIGYDYVNSKGERMNQDVAEIWEVKNYKLAKLTIYFDLTAYRNFMMGQ